jgi:bifunctional dethiobiotin synthetase / adenosylmethionine---8-amino-7-oxononanoate aminotransferase
MQGHEVAAIAMITADTPEATLNLDNDDVIARHIAVSPGGVPPKLFRLPPLGPKPTPAEGSNSQASSGIDAALQQWLSDAGEQLTAMHAHLREWHDHRTARLLAAPSAARSVIWWPFTQHKGITDGNITVIDARVGERYSVVRGHGPSSSGAPDPPESSGSFQASVHDLSVVQEYDACASWWTQGATHHLMQQGMKASA